ncbi:hypothetical protein MalM25_28180 [Planctomycetes bacterium MalM25]|nr:hypothetical protein MalM25_28180 [Planctomycetes bacterium MalM25]
MPDADRCDLAVWDLHGELAAAVRREMTGAVRRTAPKLETLCGDWRGARVVVGWPRRLTASQLPTIREAIQGLQSVHRPRRLAIVGPAAVGDSGLAPGSVVDLTTTPGLLARWSEAAAEASDELAAEAELLGAVTQAGSTPPSAARPTAARQAGRWLGKLMRGTGREPEAEVGAAVAEALAALL